MTKVVIPGLSWHARGSDFLEDSSSRESEKRAESDGISVTPSPAGLNLTELTVVSDPREDRAWEEFHVLRRAVDLRVDSGHSGSSGLPGLRLPLQTTVFWASRTRLLPPTRYIIPSRTPGPGAV